MRYAHSYADCQPPEAFAVDTCAECGREFPWEDGALDEDGLCEDCAEMKRMEEEETA